MSDICNFREGDLVRISPITSDLSYEWQWRVGLVLKKETHVSLSNHGDPTSTRWTCSFAGEIRSVSESCLEKVQ